MPSLVDPVAGLAGCSGRPSTRTPTTAPLTSPAPLDSHGCPPGAPERPGVVCSDTVDNGAAPVSLLPSEPTVSSPEALDRTLDNDATTDLTFNPHAWTVRREHVTGWDRLERRSQGDGRLVVGGGETHTWGFDEFVDTVDAETTAVPDSYTAALSVPDPTGSDWLARVALFRLS